MLKRKPELLHFTVLFFLVFLTYQESLNNYFLADDALWIMQAEKAEQTVLGFFQPVGGFLRPMVTFAYFIIYKFFNLNPAPYYIYCVVLHVVNCIVLYWFCLEFFRAVRGTADKNLAFLCAALFSVLYSHCETIIWIGALGDSFLFLFCFLSFIFFLKSLHKRILSPSFILSLVFLLLGMLSKETAFVFPVILLAFTIVFKKEVTKHAFPHFLLTFVYVIFYRKAMPSASFLDMGNAVFVVPSLLRAFKIMMVSLLGFGENIIWIFDEVNAQLFLPKLIFQCIASGAVIFYGYMVLKGSAFRLTVAPDTKKIFLFFACFIAVVYLPVALRIQLERAPLEVSQTSLRYFYFPDAAFCIMCGILLRELLKESRPKVLWVIFVMSLMAVNIICVCQTQWSNNFFGSTRKSTIERVAYLHKGYKNRPYIFLVDYPRRITIHLQEPTLLPMFRLFEMNVFFTFKEVIYYKTLNLNLSKVCFFEWANVTFVDKTAEYVHAIEKQRQQERFKIDRKSQSE